MGHGVDHPRVPDLLAQLRDDEVLGDVRLACIEELGQSVQEAVAEDVHGPQGNVSKTMMTCSKSLTPGWSW